MKTTPLDMKLFSYYRSSAAFRVRIALALKGIEYDLVPVHLGRNGGEHKAAAYLQLNPAGLVPVLQHGDVVVSQSLAIMEYLDELFPDPPLLPTEPAARARVRALAQDVACDIHPLNNLRVLQYLNLQLKIDESARNTWYRHWVSLGLGALESALSLRSASRFCYGDIPSIADCCLVPQLFNARRFNCPVDIYPRLLEIEAECQSLEAFRCAAPGRQPDAEAT